MNSLFKLIGYILFVAWIFVLGFASPNLVSADDSFLVITGFALPVILAFATYHWAKWRTE